MNKVAIDAIVAKEINPILCYNWIYFFKRYAFNRCFYLIRDGIWFGISDLYAIKQYMHLSDMQLTNFICIIKLFNFKCS